MGAMLAIAPIVMTIFRIVMGKVSPGVRTSRYMNRQMQDIRTDRKKSSVLSHRVATRGAIEPRRGSGGREGASERGREGGRERGREGRMEGGTNCGADGNEEDGNDPSVTSGVLVAFGGVDIFAFFFFFNSKTKNDNHIEQRH